MSQSHHNSADTVAESSGSDVPRESRRHRLYENLRVFCSRFLALARKPRAFAPLVVDYWLLIQSTWTGRQSGPDVVYPMLSIKKRQSGHLAKLILEHCRDESSYELHVETTFPQGIDPPCVAVIDLDEIPPRVVKKGYSTQVDLYGLTCMLMLFETIVTLVLHLLYLWDHGWLTWFNWAHGVIFNLAFCLHAVCRGDGTLTLARRSDTSAPGCAVLLDQDFTVVLNGSHSVIEAIAESSFNLSHPNSVWRLRLGEEGRGRASPYNTLEALCEGACGTVFVLCWLLFFPSTTFGGITPMVAITVIGGLVQKSPPVHLTPFQGAWFRLKGRMARASLSVVLLGLIYEQGRLDSSFLPFNLGSQSDFHFLSILLIALCSAGYRDRNYPIRSAKFLDALGHPRVRKWQFDTPAAAATFQSLVICHGIARPIRNVGVLALLDMLIPDQRDVWKAWKERVADRIVHEVDILYAPTIPTFGDERQQQLRELLDQAQSGDYAYRNLYVRSLEQ